MGLDADIFLGVLDMNLKSLYTAIKGKKVKQIETVVLIIFCDWS